MQLTHYTEYALRVLIFLSLQEPGQRVTISDIAEHFDLPRNHLLKVVHQLGRLGYVGTTRGKSGGIWLAEAPELLRLGEVVRHMEAKLGIVDCSSPSPCPILPGCRLRGILHEARDAFLGVLDRYTLTDLRRRPDQLKVLLQLVSVSH